MGWKCAREVTTGLKLRWNCRSPHSSADLAKQQTSFSAGLIVAIVCIMRAGPALAAALPEAWMTVVPGVACDLSSGRIRPNRMTSCRR